MMMIRPLAPMLIALSCLLPNLSHAAGRVNLSNGNYALSYEDTRGTAAERSLQLLRNYNSMSTYKGWFGTGWGLTEWETRLTRNPDGRWVAVQHGSGQEIVFGASNGSAGTAATWTGPQCRQEELRVVQNAELEWVDCDDQTHRFFDASGRLVRKTVVGQPTVSIRYNEQGLAQRIESDDGLYIALSWDPALRVVTRAQWNVRRGNTLSEASLTLDHDDRGALVAARASEGQTYRYDYDAHGNLTRVRYVDDSETQIAYDDRDRTVAVVPRDGTQYRFDYGDTSQGLRWVHARREASAGKSRLDRSVLLDGKGRLLQLIHDDVLELRQHFDAADGQLSSIEQGDTTIDIDRDAQGEISTLRVNGTEVFQIDHSRTHPMVRVTGPWAESARAALRRVGLRGATAPGLEVLLTNGQSNLKGWSGSGPNRKLSLAQRQSVDAVVFHALGRLEAIGRQATEVKGFAVVDTQ